MFLKNIGSLSFFNFPKKSKILFYEKIDENIFDSIFNIKNPNYIFNYSNRKINVFILFFVFFNPKSIKIIFADNLITAYSYTYIKFVKPRAILSSTDNNLNFYRLKKYFNKNLTFIVYQNGSRHEINDLFGDPNLIFCKESKKKFSVDYIFTFNSSISKIYEKYIDCKTIAIGNVKNNIVRLKSNSVKNKLIFISQFREKFLSRSHYLSHGNKVCSTKKWFEAERNLIPKLCNYCQKKNIDLYILGASKNSSSIEKEKAYFRRVAQGKKWKYWNNYRYDFKKRYQFLDKFEIAVSIWSTLASELLGRNKKVGFFRQNIKDFKDRNFGWPANFSKRGFWYTSLITQSEVDRVLNNLIHIKNSEWIDKISSTKNKVMNYDRDNKKLQNKLNSLLSTDF